MINCTGLLNFIANELVLFVEKENAKLLPFFKSHGCPAILND